ncbi:MAG: hypothetical protein LBW85_07195 [Deltaproteobacteria bacterium]|nr:hypothetical protein [Deltaproteobacteria bacterium]
MSWMNAMKAAGHNSNRQITAFLEDVPGVRMFQGAVNNALKRAAAALPPAFLELHGGLWPAPARRALDVMGKMLRMWVFVTAGAALFRKGPRTRRGPGAGPEGLAPARDLLRPLSRVRETGEGAPRPGAPALARAP